jgi:2-keto-3-deoxy-L-rhamnonate aldolase RhmA
MSNACRKVDGVRTNQVLQSTKVGRPALGISLTIPDPLLTEIAGQAGFDFVLIDTEHAPISIDQLQVMLVALRASNSTVFVRPAGNSPTLIKQILDLGAEGLIVPDVITPEDAAAAVAAAKYPPVGTRGFGPRRAARLTGGRAEYLARANDEIAVFVMIEHPDAVRAIDAILTTPGLDGIMVGPADLAVTSGYLHDLGNVAVGQAIEEVLAACERRSFPFGIFAASEAAARKWSARGARFLTIGADLQFYDQGIARTRALAAELRPAETDGR